MERAAERRFDLLVCDVGLPDGDGCDVFRAVNAMYPVKGIAVTGYGPDENLAQCMTAGFSAHLVKPVAFEKVKAVLEQLCTPADAA